MTTIWVTHDLGVVARLVDRVVVMYAGHVVEDAPVRQVFSASQHPYTKALLAALPDPADDDRPSLAQIPGRPPAATDPVEGCPFRPRCSLAVDACATRPPLQTRMQGRAALLGAPARVEKLMLTATDLVKQYPVRGGDGVVHALAVRLRRDLPAVTPA